MKHPVLLTQKIRKALPAIYSQEKTADPIVHAKFFTPDAQATWFALEFDGVDEFFGWASLGDPDMAELAYFSLAELQAIRGPLGLRIERDLYFTPCPLSVAKTGANPYQFCVDPDRARDTLRSQEPADETRDDETSIR
ncbi:MAG: DUF2958 domain-containing protein [Gemmatimonadaceae bacterium]